MMPDKIDISTASVASVAATSPGWLPQAEEAVGIVSHPVWAALLAPLGVTWLAIQIAFFVYEKVKKHRAEMEQDT